MTWGVTGLAYLTLFRFAKLPRWYDVTWETAGCDYLASFPSTKLLRWSAVTRHATGCVYLASFRSPKLPDGATWAWEDADVFFQLLGSQCFLDVLLWRGN